MHLFLKLAVLCLILSNTGFAWFLHDPEISNLRCESRVEPLGIDALHPRLSWNLESKKRGVSQVGYRIVVASSEKLLRREHGDLWDTGEVFSDQCVEIPYAGAALRSGAEYFWKVCVWDQNGKAHWSKPARWSMGLMNE
jgi:alpha-L-rhamnosidase